MKRAVSTSLRSSNRDKKVVVNFKDEQIQVERVGMDGDIAKARQMYLDLDGKVDAFGVGGVDLYLRLDQREYPLRAALKLVSGVTKTPLCDGRSFGTNMLEVALTAYAGKGRRLNDDELNGLIDDLDLKPTLIQPDGVQHYPVERYDGCSWSREHLH